MERGDYTWNYARRKEQDETDLFKPTAAAIDTQRKLISNAMRPKIPFYLEVLKEQICLLRNIVFDKRLKDETSGCVRRRRNETAHIVAEYRYHWLMSWRGAECATKWIAIFEAYYGIEINQIQCMTDTLWRSSNYSSFWTPEPGLGFDSTQDFGDRAPCKGQGNHSFMW